MILGALSDVGGQAYLARQAEKHPQAFLALLGKVLPVTVKGDADAPIAIEVVRRIIDVSVERSHPALPESVNSSARVPLVDAKEKITH